MAMTDFTNKIDWDLFRRQKRRLIEITYSMSQEDEDLIMGVVHLMDAVQDEFEPMKENDNA